jgi:hypothetical protein
MTTIKNFHQLIASVKVNQKILSFSKMNKILYPLFGLTLILLMLYNFNIITNIIEVIVNTISNILTNIIQLLKSEFIPGTILFDEGEPVSNKIELTNVRIGVRDLHHLTESYVSEEFYKGLQDLINRNKHYSDNMRFGPDLARRYNIQVGNFLGTKPIKLDDIVYSFTNSEGVTFRGWIVEA